jgi:hypothetical protein
VGGLIVANTLVMSLELQYKGEILRLEVEGACPRGDCENLAEKIPWAEAAFGALEQVFTTVFFLELCLRLVAQGFSYLKSYANTGDALIVIVSCLDSWVLTSIGGDNGAPNVEVLRLVRLVRLSKVLRVVRVMKAFKSLRVLVSAVAASVGALAWSMTLLFVLELVGTIFLAQVLSQYIEDSNLDSDVRQFLWDRFGTWYRAFFSVFEITMAPGGFLQYRRLAFEVSPIFAPILGGYVCVVTFAVVRVITAMFLKATLSASDIDEQKTQRENIEWQQEWVKRLQAMAEEEGHFDGMLYEADLKLLLEAEKMKQWLEDLDLGPLEAERLFRALDGGEGRIPFESYVVALNRMRGQPRASDTILLLHESRYILDSLRELQMKVCSQGNHLHALRHGLPHSSVGASSQSGTTATHGNRKLTRDSANDAFFLSNCG